MKTAFEDVRRIARVTTVQRVSRAGSVMRWLAGLLALGLVIGALVAEMRGRLDFVALARVAVGMAGFWLGIVWAMLFIPGSVLINSAVNARLLPRQRRRLMQMAVGGWLLCTSAIAIAFGSWAVLPIVGLYLISLPLLFTGHRQALVPAMLACTWPMLSRAVLPQSLVDAAASAPSLFVLTMLLLPAGALALRLLYPDGGDVYLARRDEQVKRIQCFANRDGANVAAGFGGPLGAGTRRLYGAILRRACRKGEPGKLLMHALGPQTHWSAWVGGIGMLLAIGLGVRALLAWGDTGKGQFVAAVANGASGVTTMLVLFCTAVIGQQMRRTRGEQALLRLTPLAGDAALLNRRLAIGMLVRTLQIWLAQTAAILAATCLIGGDGAGLLRQFALCCLAGQVATMGLLGDYAGDGGWNPMLALRAALVAAVEVIVAVGLDWLSGPSVWPWLIVIALVSGAFQLRYSWRMMLAAPVAFPAGRMA